MIEYRFFRVSWPEGALLVDFIWRRRAASAEVRVSCFHHGVATVHRSVEEREPDLPNTGPIGGCRLDQHASTGSVGPVWWDLRFHPDPREFSVPPGPLRWSGGLDLSLVSRPACAITGRIGIAGVEYRLAEQPAMTCHYWGRNLPSQWVWLSGNDFDRPGTGVEIGLIRSRLWGARVPLPRAGYAWLTTDSGQRLVVSPINGLVRCHGDRSGTAVTVTVHAPRGGFTLHAQAAPKSFVDLGEAIVQTLHARCRIRLPSGRTTSTERAALEFRGDRPR